MPFTPEELEAIRLADEEIDREIGDRYVANQVDREISAWLDELAYLDSVDHKSARNFKKRKAYRAEHKEARNAYMREYMRNYRKKNRKI